MFQNLFMYSLTTPLRNTDEVSCWQNRPFAAIWPENQSNKAVALSKTIKKKPKRVRTAYTTEQLRILEETYIRSKYIDRPHRIQLANNLNINEKCVKIWFQNRRMKEKRAHESSYDASVEGSSKSTSPPAHIQNFEVQDGKVESTVCTYSAQFENNSTENQHRNEIQDEKVETTNFSYTTPLNIYNPIPQYQMPKIRNESEFDNNNTDNQHSNETQITKTETTNTDTTQFNSYNPLPPQNATNSYYDFPNTLPSGASFCYDTNVYPTEYYPNAAEYYSDQYSEQMNYWYSNKTDHMLQNL